MVINAKVEVNTYLTPMSRSMLKQWQWKKAIASVLGAFVLVGGASGLSSCEFPGGEREEIEEGEGEQEIEQEEDDDEDD